MSDFKPSTHLGSIEPPQQNLAKLSFCNSNKLADVRAWVDNLHATQVMKTSADLYKAVPEVSHLKTDYKNRFEILEALRPSVHNCINGLAKHFLYQPLILPQEAQRTAIVAQSLQKHMLEGYVSTVMAIVQKGKANQATLDLLTKAIHRAITGINNLFLRSYQMYTQPPQNLWRKLHSLYLTAEYFELEKKSVVDPTLRLARGQTIHTAYMRTLMMACSRCNQLGQNEVWALHCAFETWAQYVKLAPQLFNHVYAVDLLGNKSPSYAAKIGSESEGQLIKEIDFTPLLRQLSRHIDSSEEDFPVSSDLEVPNDFSKSLFQHLAASWKQMPQRQLERRDINGAAEVCVGLVDCHYYLCNGQEFNYFVKNSGQDEELVSGSTSRFTPRDMHDQAQQVSYERPVFRVSLQNASAGGYCMLWKGEIPAKVEAGELLGIKEIGRRTWSIGVIRWVKQLKQASQLGIQLLSTHPKPYGIAQTYDMGGYADYSRAMYIPSSRFGSSSASILTPGAPFQEFDKVKILDGDREWSAKLEKSVFATGNINQFAFRPLGDGGDEDSATDTESSDKNFDSGWE